MDKISLKIPIMHRTVPYVYIKMSLINDRYRLSANYKYLNEQYKLKMSFIRNFEDIYNHNNKYFEIIDNMITIKDHKNQTSSQSWEMGSGENTLKIIRIIYIDSSLIYLFREYKGVKNCSIFFSSTELSSINQI